MNWKKHIIHGLVSGVMAASAAIIYFIIYKAALGVNYATVINPAAIIGSSLFGCIMMAILYALLQKFKLEKYKGILNIAIAVLSFVSTIGPISMCLPVNVASPELFPGLVIPMHFFPALAFLSLVPFFDQDLRVPVEV